MRFTSFFFFKQKTAYEMRISDWSSDVCSSDLQAIRICRAFNSYEEKIMEHKDERVRQLTEALQVCWLCWLAGCCCCLPTHTFALHHSDKIGRASCRERVCQYV